MEQADRQTDHHSKRSAYGPADANTSSSSIASLKSRMVLPFLVPDYPGCPGQKADKQV